MLHAIRKVYRNGKHISDTVAEALAMAMSIGEKADQPPHDLLSDREYQVLRMIGAGKQSVKSRKNFRSA